MVAYTAYPYDARVRREAETLAAMEEFKITVLCLKTSTRARTYTLEGVIVRELPMTKYAGRNVLRYVAAYFRFLIEAMAACSLLLVTQGVDIMHIHNMPNILVLAGILPKLFGRPLILDMHDSVPDTFASKFRRGTGLMFRLLCLEEKLSAWMSDRVICVNEIHKDVVVQRGIPEPKIVIFMNVPDHRRFCVPVQLLGPLTRDGCFRLVYHGTIEERLGVGLAVEALSMIRQRIPGVELHLWGGRDYRYFLHERAQQLGSREIVHFHDAVPVDQLPAVLSEMDVGIVPYRKTVATDLALPVKMMEYIALGIPVVVARLRAIEHYFSEETVSFFEPDSAESMAEAIVKLYQDPSRCRAQSDKAREFMSRYGWQEQSCIFLAFYEDVARRRLSRQHQW